MKIVLDIDDKNDNRDFDVIVWNDKKKKWVVESRVKFLDNIYNELKEKQKQIDELSKTIDTLKSDINDKLEQQHKVLQTLVKENN
jgi:uncharacterized protein Yka (UPF0111/DUF47 family)